MKNGLDERQNQEMARSGMYAFYVMFIVSAAVIVAELIWKGALEAVIGETVIFLAGGLTYLAVCMKKGLWSRSGRDMTMGQSALMSMVFSGIFTVFFVLALRQKVGEPVDLLKHAALFFVKISVLGFLCLTVMGWISRKNRQKQEKKYDK